MERRYRDRDFTLVELMTVVLITCALVGIAVPVVPVCDVRGAGQ
jgi:Tfp pilus assembly protein PilE